MNTSTKSCQQCGAPLSSGVRFCENCGAEVLTGVGQEQVRSAPYPSQARTTTARGNQPGKRIWWLAAGAALLALCCLLAAGAAVLIPDLRQFVGLKGFPVSAADTMVEPTMLQTAAAILQTATLTAPTTLPTRHATATVAATATIEPTAPPQPSPTLTPTTRPEQAFRDDFSSLATGWPQLDDDTRMTGYSEGAMYGIALKQPGGDSDILVPHGFELPLTTVELYFRARPVGGSGYFGAECGYIDQDNYNMIGITEGAYTIARNENGTFTSFLDPLWVHDPAITSENHEFQVQIKCGNGQIQLMVNGYSLPTVDYPGLTGGDVVIFASSSKNAVLDGAFYYEVLFDDLELKGQ
jgi:hypothetical protein